MFDPDQPPKSNVKNRPTYHCIPNPCSLFWSTWYCLPFIFNCISLNLASYLMIANLRLVLKSWGLLENQFLVLGSLAAAAAAGCQWMRRRPSRCCPAIFHRRYSATTRPSYNSKHYNSFFEQRHWLTLDHSEQHVRHGDRDLDRSDCHRRQDEEGDGIVERWKCFPVSLLIVINVSKATSL